MPDSIMSQNSYEEFRYFYLDYEAKERLFLQKIDKWEKPLKPFTCEDIVVSQDFNTYYYSRKEVDYKKGIDVTCIFAISAEIAVPALAPIAKATNPGAISLIITTAIVPPI